MQSSRHRAHSISRAISGWVGTGLMGSTLLIVSPAAAANTLSAWQFDPATRQFTVTLPQGVAPRFLVAAEPARIILEIPQTRLGQVDTERSYDGVVRSVRLAELNGDTLQVVLELAPGTVLDPNHAQLTSMAAAGQTRWVLTPLVAEAGTVATTSGTGTPQTNTGVIPELPTVALEQPLSTAGDGADLDPSESVVAVPSLPLNAEQTETALTAPPEVVADPNPGEAGESAAAPEMVVELPVIPAAEPGLGFPEDGRGRLSTTAANLMLPTDVDGLENLPETLPIDPFSIGMENTEQVTVPGLDELDAVVGPVATAPILPETEPTSAIATIEEPASPPGVTDSVPPESQAVAVTPENAVPEATPEAAIPVADEPAEAATETAQPIRVAPPTETVATESNGASDEATVAVEPSSPDEPGESQAVAIAPAIEVSREQPIPGDLEAPSLPTPGPGDSAVDPGAEGDDVDLAVIPAEPLPLPMAETGNATQPQAETAAVTTEPLPDSQIEAGVITQAPPEVVADRAPVRDQVPPSQDVLMVPELPSTDATGTVVPPSNTVSSELIVAASDPINFGQPLPGAAGKAVSDPTEAVPTAPANREVPPDILIAAGTVLQLRYPGNEPLVLDPGTNLNEVMLLESEIRDPITQGVLAPRGSQLIGQFQPNGTNQHWVSEMIIVPAGQRVPLASTSETLIGSPQVNGGRLAAGSGAGALALALLTGFSGIGLIGGAIVGATTMVGTSPQQVVIEPNQIIAVQVTENVPRAMPIAAGQDLSREWGVE